MAGCDASRNAFNKFRSLSSAALSPTQRVWQFLTIVFKRISKLMPLELPIFGCLRTNCVFSVCNIASAHERAGLLDR
jgi:hypothetical protein